MQSVTSNAVAELFSANIDNTKFTITTANITAQYTGIAYLTLRLFTSNNVFIYEDDVPILVDDRGSSASYNHQFTFLVRKGHNYRYGDTAGDISTINYFSFIPFNID